MQRMDKLLVYGQVNGTFEERQCDPELFLRATPSQGVQIVFTSWRLFQQSPRLKDLLSTEYNYPSQLWDDMHHLSNGYAGNADQVDRNGAQVRISWFHFLIKQLEKVTATSTFPKYEWYEMSFFIHSVVNAGGGTGAALLFCFDAPSDFQKALIHTMNTTRSDPPKDALAFLQSTVVGAVVKVYDASVWRARDHIRKTELARSDNDELADSNFRQLHDLARHIIHICEVLEVAVESVQELIDGTRTDPNSACGCVGVSNNAKTNCPHSEMRFWLRMLRNFGRRAASLKSRLLNEINLGFNVVVQRDSKATVEISRGTMDISLAAKSDSASMKTIAVVTLAFLPATFVSTVFSMSFFELSIDENGQQEWNMSDQFWIYWVIAIPLTVMTLVAWTYGQRAELRRLFVDWRTRQPKVVV